MAHLGPEHPLAAVVARAAEERELINDAAGAHLAEHGVTAAARALDLHEDRA